MSSELTYASLLASASSYMERPTSDDAFEAERPQFVALAESQISAEFKQQGFLTVVSGTFDLAETLEKPTLWRSTLSLRGKRADGTWFPLLLRNYEYIRACYQAPTTGQPRYYADYNATNYLIAPVPDQAYALELTYYAKLSPLADTNQTNWLTLNAPQLLLAATLVEAALWCKDDAKLAFWQARYDRALQGLLGENASRLSDRTQEVRA
jgi:hypothetical protein